MAIEIIKAKGIVKQSGIKILLYGFSGSGKSSQFKFTGKTLLLSSEKGELVLNEADNVDIIRVNSLGELKEAYVYAKEHVSDYDTVGIDSISEIGEMIVSELKKDPEYSSLKDGMKMWMKFSEIMLGIAKSFRDLDNVNVLIVALAESVTSGLSEKLLPMIPAKKVQSKLASLYDEVLFLRTNEEGKREFVTSETSDIVAKDRSGKLEPLEECTKEYGIGTILKKIRGEKNK